MSASSSISVTAVAPLIGITGRRWPAIRLGEWTVPALYPAEIDLHYSDYPDAVIAAGGVPVQIPQVGDPSAYVARLDGVLISGGADVDPAVYGAEPSPDLGLTEPDRDAFELALLRAALEQGVPVLGICRGFQVVNVAFGGTLVQHVDRDAGDGHPRFSEPRDELAHTVSCVQGSVAFEVMGATALVNSLHHQTVERLGEGLTASAHSPDGTIEAVEHSAHPDLFAVQWHPEMLAQPSTCLTWLVGRARARASAASAT